MRRPWGAHERTPGVRQVQKKNLKSLRTGPSCGSCCVSVLRQKKYIFRRAIPPYSTRFLNFGHFTFVGCVFYGIIGIFYSLLWV